MVDLPLPPISFASRGFVRHDGSVFGWSLLDGDHASYHRAHGTTDADFQTRWRQWSEGERIDLPFSQNSVEAQAVRAWIEANADASIPMPRPE